MRGLKYAVLQTLDISSSKIEGTVEGQKARIGQDVNVSVTRNKLAPPYRTASVPLYFEHGLDLLFDLVNLGITLDIITLAGSWLSIVDENGEILMEKIQGKDKLKAALVERQDLLDYLEQKIKSKLQGG